MGSDPRTVPNIPALLAALARYRVRYVLFGSGGAAAYGAALAPGDLDVCPAPDPDNLRRLGAALADIGGRPRVIPGWMTPEASTAWTPEPPTPENVDHLFATDFGDFDVVPRPFGPHGDADRFTFETLDARAVTLRAFGVEVRVASLDDLIASKMSRRRDKDLRASAELERLRRDWPGGDDAGRGQGTGNERFP